MDFATTSLLPTLLFTDPDGYIFRFSCIAALNHLLKHEECLIYFETREYRYRHAIDATNNIVKLFLTPIILKGVVVFGYGFPTWCIKIIQLFDILPFVISIFQPKYRNIAWVFETFGGYLRQTIVAYQLCTLLNVYMWNEWVGMMCIFGVLNYMYYSERCHRILNNDRSNFGFAHHAEHIFIAFYIFLFVGTWREAYGLRYVMCYFSTVYLIYPVMFTVVFNMYTIYNYTRHGNPLHMDNILEMYFTRKIMGNVYSKKYWNYLVKSWSYKLSGSVMSVSRIRRYLDILSGEITSSCAPDLIVGVCSGGAFCCKLLEQNIKDRNYHDGCSSMPTTHTNDVGVTISDSAIYLKTKVWSNQSLMDSAMLTSEYLMRSQKAYLSKSVNVGIINQRTFDQYKQLYDSGAIKTILLFDDTICTGKTISSCKKWIAETFPNADIKVACFITDVGAMSLVDYYVDVGKVPVYWPWGAELD